MSKPPCDNQFREIGRPIRRKEDHRLLTGQGAFSDDFVAPGQLYAVMVRSPYPHARIRSIHTSHGWQNNRVAIPGRCRAESATQQGRAE